MGAIVSVRSPASPTYADLFIFFLIAHRAEQPQSETTKPHVKCCKWLEFHSEVALTVRPTGRPQATSGQSGRNEPLARFGRASIREHKSDPWRRGGGDEDEAKSAAPADGPEAAASPFV